MPYGFYRPEFAEWWLVPGPNPMIPAYAYSKMLVWTTDPGPEGELLLLGYYVEKGFDRTAAAMPEVKASHILQPHWFWHTFRTAALAGKLERPIEDVARVAGQPVVISLGLGEFNKPPDERKEIKHGDKICLVLDKPGAALRIERAGGSVLAPLNSCGNLTQIFSSLEGIDTRFYWLDLRIGVKCHLASRGPATWNAADIWQKTMEPWVPWLR